MTPADSAEWLVTRAQALRQMMVQRLEADSLGADAKREMGMALEELDRMWEELQGQAALLLRENARYAEFFEYAPDAYVITDAGGSLREANQAALELLAAPRDQVVSRTLGDYIPAEERVAFLARTVGVMLGGKPDSWKARLQPAHGAALEVELSVRAIALKQSDARGLCWLLRPA